MTTIKDTKRITTTNESFLYERRNIRKLKNYLGKLYHTVNMINSF